MRATLLNVVCCLSLAGPGTGLARAETIDRVLAVVEGRPILLSDVTAARDLGLVPMEEAADPVRAILPALIDRELMLVEVDRFAPPEPPADAVARELAEVRDRFASDEAFEAALARSGLDVANVRATLRENLRIRAYIDQRFVARAGRPTQAGVDDWLAGLRARADIVMKGF